MRPAVWAFGCMISMYAVGCGSGEADEITIEEAGPAQIWATSDTITDLRDVAFTSDGSAWVLNMKAPFLIKLDPNGKVERIWGNQGDGPGEYQHPDGLVTAAGGKEIWVRDGLESFFNLAVSTEDPPSIRSNRSRRLISMGSSHVGNPFWSTPSDSGILVAQGDGDDLVASYTAEIVELRADGSSKPRLSLGKLLADPGTIHPGATAILPFPLWAYCPDRTVALYDPLANVIRRYDAGVKLIDSISLPPPQKIEITFERVYQLFGPVVRNDVPPEVAKDTAKFRAEMKNQYDAFRSRMAKVFPEYNDLRCDPANRLWIQPFDYAAGDWGGGPVWYQLAPKGLSKGIKLPANFRPVEFATDRIWGVARDDDGVPSIAWVKIPTR